MKRGIALLLLFALFCGLWGCGTSEYVGIYKGVYVQVEEKVYHMEDYFNGENYLELKPRGKALMMTGATEHELTWKVDEGEITFTEAGDSFCGYVTQDGVIRLDYMGWGMELTFVMEGVPIPETTVANPAAYEEAVNAVQAYWNGDWYGWWYISEGTGVYAAQQRRLRDTAARIDLGDNARGTIRIWDMDHPYQTPLAESILRVDPMIGEGTMGIAMSGQGTFMGQPVLAGDWLIDPSVAAYSNLLEINGYYTDEKGDFFYTMYLRPWGQGWEDVLEAEDPSVMPNELPEHYGLYLEALKAGTSPEDFFS